MDILSIDQQMMLKSLWKDIQIQEGIVDNRERRNVIWKHAFSVAVLDNTSLSLQGIGDILGKNHATIIHAKKIHEINYSYDSKYRIAFDQLNNTISDLMDEYNVKVKDAIRSRTQVINPSIEKLEKDWEKKLERVQRREREKYDVLEYKYKSVCKALRDQSERASRLNDELARVKNLI